MTLRDLNFVLLGDTRVVLRCACTDENSASTTYEVLYEGSTSRIPTDLLECEVGIIDPRGDQVLWIGLW